MHLAKFWTNFLLLEGGRSDDGDVWRWHCKPGAVVRSNEHFGSSGFASDLCVLE